MAAIKILLLHAQSPKNKTLSYQMGWPEHLQRHPQFTCLPLNVAERSWFSALRDRAQLQWGNFEVVVILHSVFSNACYLSDWLLEAIQALPQPKVYFIGNEYKLMPEKISFCKALNLALLVSQSNDERVINLYQEDLNCEVTGIVSTGLDEDLFQPRIPRSQRPIDLGYRSYPSPRYLGHNERQEIADYFSALSLSKYGLHTDISLDPKKRFARREWANFLNRCKGQLGTEAGGDYFELTDAIRNRVNNYEKEQPKATLEEIHGKFFQDYQDPIPLRVISGRHIEAAGTKTVQILFEGQYSGYFQPDVHYIPLKKDFSNVDEAIAKFKDEAYCREITENAYRVVKTELTYNRLIDQFYNALIQVI